MNRNANFAISPSRTVLAHTTNGPPRSRQGRRLRLSPALPSTRGDGAALKREQAPLVVEPTRVAAERAVGCEHAMAGHHDRDGVRAERLARGAHRAGVPRTR